MAHRPFSKRNGVAQAVKTAIASAVFFGASQVQALGLGNLEHESYIGEPLSANIEILDSGDDYSTSEIRVRQVSSSEASDKLNLNLITNHFRLDIKPYTKDGRLFVKVGSKNPIDEPFIDFLLELSWTGGQVYREYTLLMDLPPVVSAAEIAPKVSQSPKPQAQKAPTNPAAPTRPEPGFSSGTLGGSYQVKSGDTLSHIAEQWRLGSQHSLKDTEQWLFDNNGHAFLNGNRNQLMLGARLRFPTADNLPQAGLATVAKDQTEVQSSIEAVIESPSTGPAVTAEPVNAEELQGRLRLGNNSTIGSEELQQKAQDPQSNTEIRDLIHITQETADRIVRENEELKRRIENIEGSEYIQNMEKLVALQRDEIEQLRRSLEQRATAPIEMPAPAQPPVPVVDNAATDPATVSSSSTTVVQQSNSYSTWFWVLTILSALMAMLIAALVSFRLGQKSRSDNDVQPLAVPETAVVPPAVEDPDVAELGPIKTPDDLGDEDIIPLELDDPAELEDVGEIEEALEDMDLLPEDEALFTGMSNREAVVEVPESLMVDADLDGLNSVRLPGLVAEELDTEGLDDDSAAETSVTTDLTAEAIGGDEISFDLELDDEFLAATEAAPSNMSASAEGLDLDGLEADLFKDNRDDVDELISTAMIFASFDDYDKAEELLINESAHYIDEPRIIKALEQLAKARKKFEGESGA